MSAEIIEKLSDKIEKLESRIEQLYKAHYNPPTNNDLYKTLNDLVDRMNVALGSLKRLER
tara:strand:+ start:436 stop:615 length:180 start_codon:yes stop_codon:yes gene_type:complete